MSLLDTSRFWNLEKDFFLESENSGADYYNTYADFIKQSKINSNLKKFKYNNVFNFVPSYGSSSSITFLNIVSEYGDNYVSSEPSSINRIAFEFNLKFDNRSDEEAGKIINYINSKNGADFFPFQSQEREGLDFTNAYKSLYSIKPYIIQEFYCNSITSSSNYIDNNNINLNFTSDLFSQFTMRNLIYAECLPSETKNLINEYWGKERLDIRPSYPLSREEDFNVSDIKLGSSKQFSEKDGVNSKLAAINLSFKSVDDETLLKLMSFFISKQGYESFELELEKPEKKIINVTTSRIEHTFLYMNAHDIKITVSEVPVRKKFFFKP